MAKKVEKFEDTAAKIREYKEIIRTKKKNIIFIAYQQGKVFKRFKEKENFIQMLKRVGINNSEIILKINMLKLIDEYPRLMRSSVNLNFLKAYLRAKLTY